jgi:hypothetical protein
MRACCMPLYVSLCCCCLAAPPCLLHLSCSYYAVVPLSLLPAEWYQQQQWRQLPTNAIDVVTHAAPALQQLPHLPAQLNRLQKLVSDAACVVCPVRGLRDYANTLCVQCISQLRLLTCARSIEPAARWYKLGCAWHQRLICLTCVTLPHCDACAPVAQPEA